MVATIVEQSSKHTVAATHLTSFPGGPHGRRQQELQQGVATSTAASSGAGDGEMGGSTAGRGRHKGGSCKSV